MSIRRTALAVVAAAALASASCGISDPSNAHTDTFSGTIAVGGRTLHSFSVSQNGGEVNIKLTELSPDTGASLGLAYGQFASGSTTDCIGIQQTALASLGRTALTNTITKGTYCVSVFDSGFITRPETYTLTVSHP